MFRTEIITARNHKLGFNVGTPDRYKYKDGVLHLPVDFAQGNIMHLTEVTMYFSNTDLGAFGNWCSCIGVMSPKRERFEIFWIPIIKAYDDPQIGKPWISHCPVTGQCTNFRMMFDENI